MVVAMAGEVDVARAQVRAELRLAQALRPGRLILDLSGVTFLDAAGISAILAPCRGGDLRVTLIAPPGRVRRLLGIVGADRGVEILDAPPGAEPPELPSGGLKPTSSFACARNGGAVRVAGSPLATSGPGCPGRP